MDSEQEMNASKEETQEQRHAAVGKDGHGQKPEPHHATKRELDDEIAAIQAHSRHQSTTIQAPPEISPAPPRRALLVVGVALLVLLVAGAMTLIGRASHERALAKETEQETIPTVAVVRPLAEKPDQELVL